MASATRCCAVSCLALWQRVGCSVRISPRSTLTTVVEVEQHVVAAAATRPGGKAWSAAMNWSGSRPWPTCAHRRAITPAGRRWPTPRPAVRAWLQRDRAGRPGPDVCLPAPRIPPYRSPSGSEQVPRFARPTRGPRGCPGLSRQSPSASTFTPSRSADGPLDRLDQLFLGRYRLPASSPRRSPPPIGHHLGCRPGPGMRRRVSCRRSVLSWFWPGVPARAFLPLVIVRPGCSWAGVRAGVRARSWRSSESVPGRQP